MFFFNLGYVLFIVLNSFFIFLFWLILICYLNICINVIL